MKYSPLTTLTIAALFLSISWGVPGLAQRPATIYDDDPAQKIPLGLSKPAYARIEADGGPIDQIRVEPPFWWVGMQHPILEVLIYDQDIRDYSVSVDYPGVKLNGVTRLENPNYLFLELEIGPGVKPGKFNIRLSKDNTERTYSYELRQRKTSASRVQGLNSGDLVYLLMPDRFANGDYSNDSYLDLNQVGVHRGKMYFRHGGDLQGVIDHLDYLVDLGVTALWLNPVLENDQPYESYHGYAVTDHYRIDPRLGTNEKYVELVEACHLKGVKVVMDIIHNHVGDQHWFIRDLPDRDWIHQSDQFQISSFRAPSLMDPYAARSDRKAMSDGWFDHHMPDLNQQHPQLANYLIQNNIWWIEYTGQDAYRLDTYAYPDQEFMAEWGRRLQAEFPGLGLFAETWVHGPAVQAQFTQNNHLREGYNSHMPAVTDFQLYYAINEALSRPQGWTEGVSRIYYTLAQDFLYEDPYRNVTFLDNHDLSRFYSVIGEDLRKYKSGIAFLLTMRGIPSIYYGTEILMKNFKDPDGKVREDFPGGWKADTVNKFFPSGRTASEQEAFNYVRTLAQYRQKTPALQHGKLTQFVPVDGIYVYFRHDGESSIMVVMNTNEDARKVPTSRYQERMQGYTSAVEVVSGRKVINLQALSLQPYETLVLELR